MDQDFRFFELTFDGPVATLAMNRPDKANGMSPEFWQELPVIMAMLDDDPAIRVVVLSGHGRHFTGGMDLSAFQALTELVKKEPGRAAFVLRRWILELQAAFNAIEHSRLPVIAVIHGACLGAGIDLTSACDIRLASRDAFFGIEEINIGMAADVGTLQRLPKLMPPGIVKELAFTGRRFTPEEAKAWGFVNEVCDDVEATQACAMALASDIAAKSPLAIAGIKKAVDHARDHAVADSLEHIATWNAAMLRPEDVMAAIQAKMTGKAAVFADLERLSSTAG